MQSEVCVEGGVHMEAGLINMGLVWLTQRALHGLPASILNGTEHGNTAGSRA